MAVPVLGRSRLGQSGQQTGVLGRKQNCPPVSINVHRPAAEAAAPKETELVDAWSQMPLPSPCATFNRRQFQARRARFLLHTEHQIDDRIAVSPDAVIKLCRLNAIGPYEPITLSAGHTHGRPNVLRLECPLQRLCIILIFDNNNRRFQAVLIAGFDGHGRSASAQGTAEEILQ